MNILRVVPSASFSRPADTTAYASGDLVANSTTAGSVVPLSLTPTTRGSGLSGQIRRVRIVKSTTGVTNAQFRLHLFNAAPTVSSGDNAAIVIATGAANYLGQVDVTMNQSFTDGGSGQATTEINVVNGTLYALLEARAAYTPGNAETFTVTLEASLD
jgi:hypothetical protein